MLFVISYTRAQWNVKLVVPVWKVHIFLTTKEGGHYYQDFSQRFLFLGVNWGIETNFLILNHFLIPGLVAKMFLRQKGRGPANVWINVTVTIFLKGRSKRSDFLGTANVGDYEENDSNTLLFELLWVSTEGPKVRKVTMSQIFFVNLTSFKNATVLSVVKCATFAPRDPVQVHFHCGF